MKENDLIPLNTALICDYMDKHKMNEKEFAKECGITLYALQEIMKGRGDFVVSKYVKIANVLGIYLKDLCGF